MKQSKQQSGVASWELVLVVLVLGAIVLVGYHVYASRVQVPNSVALTSSTAGSTAQSIMPTSPTAVPTAPSVTKTSDLDTAAADLNAVDPSSSNNADSNLLTSQSNF